MEGPLALSDNDYLAKGSTEEVEIECDVEFLPETDQEEVEVPMTMTMYRKRKPYDDEVGSSSSQLKRRRLSTIVEDPDFRLEGEPVYEEVAKYEEKSKMFIQEGKKMDLISLIRKLSDQEDLSFDQEEKEEKEKEESMTVAFDENSNILEKLKSSPFFLQHKKSVRSCALGTTKEFDKTDPSLPEGFRVRGKVRGDGKRVDKEFLNPEGTLIFRSKPAVLAYVRILNEDTLEEEDDQADLKTLSRKKIGMLTKAVYPISTIKDLSPAPPAPLQSSNPQLDCLPHLVDQGENLIQELGLDKPGTINLGTSDTQEADDFVK
eukprot:GFUD01038637.1.p1 GENE.GFUD01038637.1~~GFUD01038637.1.p1  ORF type:complete len:319 (+),score=100.57 GFUD01038637.1:66-1022(+)